MFVSEWTRQTAEQLEDHESEKRHDQVGGVDVLGRQKEKFVARRSRLQDASLIQLLVFLRQTRNFDVVGNERRLDSEFVEHVHLGSERVDEVGVDCLVILIEPEIFEQAHEGLHDGLREGSRTGDSSS